MTPAQYLPAFALLLLIGLAVAHFARAILPAPSGGTGVDLIAALRSDQRRADAMVMLETGAFISLVVSLVGLTGAATLPSLVLLGGGLTIGLLVMPGFTRPALGLGTAAMAFLRLDPRMMRPVLLAASAFFVARFLMTRVLGRA